MKLKKMATFVFLEGVMIPHINDPSAMNSLPNKYIGMRRGVQVSFEERNPTRDLAPYSLYVDLK